MRELFAKHRVHAACLVIGLLVGRGLASLGGNWRPTGDGKTIVHTRTGELRVAATGEPVEKFNERKQGEDRLRSELELTSAEMNLIGIADIKGPFDAQQQITEIQLLRYQQGRQPLDMVNVKIIAPNWAKHQVGISAWRDIRQIDASGQVVSPAKPTP